MIAAIAAYVATALVIGASLLLSGTLVLHVVAIIVAVGVVTSEVRSPAQAAETPSRGWMCVGSTTRRRVAPERSHGVRKSAAARNRHPARQA